MVGSSLAVGLEGAGARTALVERSSMATLATATFDGRGSAIAAGSKQILEGVGLWDALAADAEPILEIRVADGRAPFFLPESPMNGIVTAFSRVRAVRVSFARHLARHGAPARNRPSPGSHTGRGTFR